MIYQEPSRLKIDLMQVKFPLRESSITEHKTKKEQIPPSEEINLIHVAS
jgi:hypothetical protein